MAKIGSSCQMPMSGLNVSVIICEHCPELSNQRLLVSFCLQLFSSIYLTVGSITIININLLLYNTCTCTFQVE